MTDQPTPDPLAYGPTGYTCGCGKDAHSNLTPCAPSDAELIEHARTVGMVEPEKAPAFVAAYRAHVECQAAAIGTQPVPQRAEITAAEADAFVAAEEQPAPAVSGDLFTEAAIYASALHAAAIEAENTARMFCDEPESRTTVETLQGLAERFRRLARGQAANEQPAAPTWEDRAAHAVGMYATTAIGLEDARRDVATLRARVAELEAAAAPLATAERQFLTFALDEAADEMANRDGFTDEDTAALAMFRRMASTAPEAVDQAEEQPAAAHPDTVESLLDELADDIPNRRAHAIAANYLARYTRLLVADARERMSQRNEEMRAEGYRGRVAWCSGMREVAALLDVRADAIAEAGR